MSVFTSIINEILNMFKSFSFSNLLDILIVAFIIYKAIQFIRETKAGQLFKSLLQPGGSPLCVYLHRYGGDFPPAVPGAQAPQAGSCSQAPGAEGIPSSPCL